MNKYEILPSEWENCHRKIWLHWCLSLLELLVIIKHKTVSSSIFSPRLTLSSLQSHHFMGNRWGNSVRLYFWGSKITADGDCSHEIKRCLLLGRKVMTNLDSIFKSKNITLPTKVHLVKAVVFPVVMYGYESWTVKEAEHWRIDGFELWCWRRLLRVFFTLLFHFHQEAF